MRSLSRLPGRRRLSSATTWRPQPPQEAGGRGGGAGPAADGPPAAARLPALTGPPWAARGGSSPQARPGPRLAPGPRSRGGLHARPSAVWSGAGPWLRLPEVTWWGWVVRFLPPDPRFGMGWDGRPAGPGARGALSLPPGLPCCPGSSASRMGARGEHGRSRPGPGVLQARDPPQGPWEDSPSPAAITHTKGRGRGLSHPVLSLSRGSTIISPQLLSLSPPSPPMWRAWAGRSRAPRRASRWLASEEASLVPTGTAHGGPLRFSGRSGAGPACQTPAPRLASPKETSVRRARPRGCCSVLTWWGRCRRQGGPGAQAPRPRAGRSAREEPSRHQEGRPPPAPAPCVLALRPGPVPDLTGRSWRSGTHGGATP